MADDIVRRTERAPDFKVIAADTFGLRLSDNMIHLAASVDLNVPGSHERIAYEQIVLAMSPRSAKILSLVLQQTIGLFEEKFGTITLPPGKIEQINANLEKARSDAQIGKEAAN